MVSGRRQEPPLWVLGIDFKTGAAHVVAAPVSPIRGRRPRHTRIDFPGADAFDRLRNTREEIDTQLFVALNLDWRDVLAVGIEEPQAAPKFRATIGKLKATQGAIVAAVPASTLCVMFQPSEWRAKAGLPGDAPKAAVLEWARGELELRDGQELEQDTADALGVAYATRAAL